MKIKSVVVFFVTLFAASFSLLKAQIVHLSPELFYKETLAQKNSIQLFDMRNEASFARGHIKKARQFDYESDDFENEITQQFSFDVPLLIYCASGEKSNEAAVFLHEIGFKKVIVLEGGFVNWASKSKPYVSFSKAIEPSVVFTTKDFERLVTSQPIVLVDFFATWCGPCKKLSPILSKLETEMHEVNFLKLDADTNELIVNHLSVSEIPTLLLYKNGRQVWRSTGILSEEQLRAVLGKFAM